MWRLAGGNDGADSGLESEAGTMDDRRCGGRGGVDDGRVSERRVHRSASSPVVAGGKAVHPVDAEGLSTFASSRFYVHLTFDDLPPNISSTRIVFVHRISFYERDDDNEADEPP